MSRVQIRIPFSPSELPIYVPLLIVIFAVRPGQEQAQSGQQFSVVHQDPLFDDRLYGKSIAKIRVSAFFVGDEMHSAEFSTNLLVQQPFCFPDAVAAHATNE